MEKSKVIRSLIYKFTERFAVKFIGLVIGITLVLLQQHFGLVAMPGNFAITAYPVQLQLSDILWTVAGVAGIGFIMALIPSKKL